jgi:predicted metal-dependent hydrolase
MQRQAELPLDLETPAAGETPRTIALGDRIVPYILRRARRHTIGLTIDHRGLRVGAPHRAPLIEVETLIRKHGDWVRQKLDEWRSRRCPEPLRLTDGTRLPCLGGEVEIRLAAGNNRAVWNTDSTLTLCLRAPEHAGGVLEKALKALALEHFHAELTHHAARFGLATPPLRLSSARTRWGSCSQRSGIRLNWRLIHFSPQIIDYVIVHELAHLREMNHSPRFWAIVAHYCPDFRAARARLKQLSATLPAFA